MSFLAELKRRKVIRVGIAYAIGAWLVLQLTEVLSELLSLPASIGPIVVGVVAIGFPIVLALAWVFELTADGLKRDSEVTADMRSSGRWLNALVVVLLVLALGYFVWESRFRDSTPGAKAADAASTDVGDHKSIGRAIAVLPFESFSEDPANAYFADGLSDTLLHKLAQIRELKVIARNSSFQFKNSNQDVREIGEILGVETLLEGSVQRSGERVRVIAQLVRTSDGAHIWSQSFDDSAENILELQDRIASSIVDQFQLSLSQSDRLRMLQDGTDIPEAYDLVLRAMNQQQSTDELTDSSDEESGQIRLLRQALEIDPGYALAWAYLSNAYNSLAFAADSARDFQRYVAEAEAAVQRAMELDPSLPQPHAEQGWVAHRQGKRMEAARHFRKALELDPNDLSAMSGLALQLWNDPEEALRLIDRSLELDPTSAVVYRQRHFMLMGLNRPEEALESLDKAIELSPSTGMFYNDAVDLLERMGRPADGAAYASRLLRQVPNSFSGQMAMAEAWLAAADYERAAAWVSLLASGRDDSDSAKLLDVEVLVASGQFQAAMDRLDTVTRLEDTEGEISVRRLAACLGLGQGECAVQQAKIFRQGLADAQLKSGGMPLDFEFYVAVGEMLAKELVEPDYAVSVAAGTLLVNPMAGGSRFFGPIYFARAGLYARAGNPKQALYLLQQAVPEDSMAVFNLDLFGMDVERSRLLDPLRDQPEFQAWLQRYRHRRQAVIDEMHSQEQGTGILSLEALRSNLN